MNDNDLVALMIATAPNTFALVNGGPAHHHSDILIKKCGCTNKTVCAIAEGRGWTLTEEGRVFLSERGLS